MTIRPLKYKEKAIDKLLAFTEEILNDRNSDSIVLQAPTGAGKTIIMADFLLQFVQTRKDKRNFSFIWAAPRKLHLQSLEKLERFYSANRAIVCSSLEELNDKKIGENEVLFINWESINKKDNIFVRENENDFNLTTLINRTLEEGREIVLIIDESHHTSTAENTRGLIKIMQPKITIEVSATPHLGSDKIVKIKHEDVVEEGMIKESVSLNPDLKSDKLEGEGSDEFILKEALKKRAELKKEFEDMGKDINPLLLIQLPDNSSIEFENKKEKIEELLASKFKITDEKGNGKLAVYTSEDKRNLENISKNNNEVEVLLFKQAIALGWDCPRAYILVLFREWHSEKFSIQTVGRIMRMPEITHYNNSILNKGYVYTNISNNKIKIEEDLAKDYFTLYTGKRDPSYKDIDLESFHIKRQRETTRLAPSFIQVFISACHELDLISKIDLKVTKITDHIPVDGIIHTRNIGTAFEPVEIYGDISLAKNLMELELAFKHFIQNTLSANGLFPEQRSVGRICTAIYFLFSSELKINYEKNQREIMTIVLHENNIQHFTDAINSSLKNYRQKHPKAKNEYVKNEDAWNVPEKIDYTANHKEVKKVKSIIFPYFESTSEGKTWKTEEQFIEFLEKNEKVEWWFKNGERDATFFAVPYLDSENEGQVFYVDFIVKTKDRRIGLFDTKSGITAAIAGNKSDGLQKYIKEQNKKGKKLFGGIVHPKSGSFFCYTLSSYKYDKELTGWDVLSL